MQTQTAKKKRAAARATHVAQHFFARPDAKGRVTLGQEHTAGVSRFEIEILDDGNILLKPKVEVPAYEAWLWKNKTALASVQRGLEQMGRGETHDLGDFTKYAED